jgi:hypothetical protein
MYFIDIIAKKNNQFGYNDIFESILMSIGKSNKDVLGWEDVLSFQSRKEDVHHYLTSNQKLFNKSSSKLDLVQYIIDTMFEYFYVNNDTIDKKKRDAVLNVMQILIRCVYDNKWKANRYLTDVNEMVKQKFDPRDALEFHSICTEFFEHE